MQFRAAGAGRRARNPGALPACRFPALREGLVSLRQRAGRVVAPEFARARDDARPPSDDFSQTETVTAAQPPSRRRAQS